MRRSWLPLLAGNWYVDVRTLGIVLVGCARGYLGRAIRPGVPANPSPGFSRHCCPSGLPGETQGLLGFVSQLNVGIADHLRNFGGRRLRDRWVERFCIACSRAWASHQHYKYLKSFKINLFYRICNFSLLDKSLSSNILSLIN